MRIVEALTMSETKSPTSTTSKIKDNSAPKSKQTPPGNVSTETTTTPNTNGAKMLVPSFIRLFIMYRTFYQSKSLDVDSLATVFPNGKEKQAAKLIVTRLMKFGLLTFMKKHYNENEQGQLIELIMKQIVFKQFSNEYKQHIDYKALNKNSKYQELAFNTQDVMCNIFQFLTFCELLNCSLVDTHWLYHTWNINSVYYVDLTNLVSKTGKSVHAGNYNYYARIWQRIVNARSIVLRLLATNKLTDFNHDKLINRVSMLGNVEKIGGICKNEPGDIAILKTIINKCKNKIRHYSLEIHIDARENDKQNILPDPLELVNLNYIRICDLVFYIKWSKNCDTLNIERMDNISDEWLNHAINNCDCSGIKSLILFNVEFEMCDEELLKKFAQKFVSLKQLTITILANIDSCLLFCTFLKDVIANNNTKIDIRTGHYIGYDNYVQLRNIFRDNKLAIDKMEIGVGDESRRETWNLQFRGIKKTIASQSNIRHLKIKNWQKGGKHLQQFVDYIQNSTSNNVQGNCKANDEKKDGDGDGDIASPRSTTTFAALKIIEIEDIRALLQACSNLGLIEKFLQLDIISKQNLFVIGNFKAPPVNEKDFLASFKSLCKNVFRLISSARVAIDINILFEQLYNAQKMQPEAQEIFMSYFNEKKLLNECDKKLQRNEYYNPLMKPVASFAFEEVPFYHNAILFHVANVENLTVCDE